MGIISGGSIYQYAVERYLGDICCESSKNRINNMERLGKMTRIGDLRFVLPHEANDFTR